VRDSPASTCVVRFGFPPAAQDALKQQDWKIERLSRDNRALEAANGELRQRIEAVKEENLQVGWRCAAQPSGHAATRPEACNAARARPRGVLP
jgi:hypothetical protein